MWNVTNDTKIEKEKIVRIGIKRKKNYALKSDWIMTFVWPLKLHAINFVVTTIH